MLIEVCLYLDNIMPFSQTFIENHILEMVSFFFLKFRKKRIKAEMDCGGDFGSSQRAKRRLSVRLSLPKSQPRLPGAYSLARLIKCLINISCQRTSLRHCRSYRHKIWNFIKFKKKKDVKIDHNIN